MTILPACFNHHPADHPRKSEHGHTWQPPCVLDASDEKILPIDKIRARGPDCLGFVSDVRCWLGIGIPGEFGIVS